MVFTLPKKTRMLWQVRTAFVLVMLCVVLVAFCQISLWYLLPVSIVVTIGPAIIFVYIPLYFKSYKIGLYNNSMCIIKGVIIKRRFILPYLRLVFVKSITTPLVSVLKLKIIMLKVAKGWIVIPEINNYDADIILKAISGEIL